MPHAAARRALIAALAALAVAAPAAAQTMYKWVDEKGVTHFSEMPPPADRKATKVTPKVTPPSSEAARPAPSWKERELDNRKRRIERDQADEAARARSHNAAAERLNLCNQARRELHIVSRQAPVYYLDDRGERVYLDDSQRAAAADRWRRQMEAHCDSR